jgi:uncharacterized protein (DUF1015 family)
MVAIAPFRGILYDTSRVEVSRVLAPPYDVIDADERARLWARDPYNCVRLILPEGEGDARYLAAARELSAWQEAGILVRDERPALYRYHQVFSSPELGPAPVTRRGLIGAVRLHRFEEGIILPHERTLKGPKVDRLKLMDATGAHLSQIFTLYADPAGAVDDAFAAVDARDPDLAGATDDGTRHVLWRVDEPGIIDRVRQALAALPLYIADGHHRYETMLAYRDRLLAGRGWSARSSARFGTLFLANMDDPGLVVLPTHRLIHGVAGFSAAAVIEGARAHFHVEPVVGGAADAERVRALLRAAGARGSSFAMVTAGTSDATLLTLRAGFDTAAAGLSGPPALGRLDVTLLHTLVLERLLGIDRAALEAQTHITYVTDTQKGLDRLSAGAGQAGFFMNPTRVDQVRQVADAGACMPQKSTFFYPKLASGVVFRTIRADEELV